MPQKLSAAIFAPARRRTTYLSTTVRCGHPGTSRYSCRTFGCNVRFYFMLLMMCLILLNILIIFGSPPKRRRRKRRRARAKIMEMHARKIRQVTPPLRQPAMTTQLNRDPNICTIASRADHALIGTSNFESQN